MKHFPDDIIGKTIKEIEKIHPYKSSYEDSGFTDDVALKLVMVDGSEYIFYGHYGGYTGHSVDEYVELPEIVKVENSSNKSKIVKEK
jgi:hypothetical protein